MSERKLYEQLIAEKLQQLPVPDADAGWQQMKRLLDEDETPRGGGKIPGPRGKWWWAGFAALLVSTGAVFYYHQGDNEVSKEQLAVNASNNNNSIAGKGNTQTAKVSATTPSNYNNNNQQNAGINNTSTLKSNSSNTSIAPKNNEAANNGAATATAVANKATVTPAVTNNRTNAGVYSAANNKPVTPTVKTNTHITVNKTKTNNSKTKNSYLKSTLSVAAVKSNNPSASKSNLGSSAKHSGTNVQTGISNLPPVDNDVDVLDEVLIQKQHQRIKLLQALTVNTLPAAPVTGMELNTIPAEKEAALHAVDEAAVAATMKKLKQAEKDLKKEERKERRAFNMEQVFKPFSLKADGEPWWAVGLALNAGITTGSQQRVNYNSSAKSSTVSDYLPSPYVQYHVNDNVFLQTEINLSMPQYTPRLLLFQNEMSNVSGNTLSKSVYVQKLYYFSWPVSLHYSPVKNLYFNGGLQFSSFQSGIALIQQSNQNNQVVKSDVLRFRDDSIAARLTPNEWRWQTGADYYMNRFTFGLRYNKSFKDLVNLQLNSRLPPTVARNNAFLFYMRYNLFDGRGSRNASANSSLVRW